MFMYRLVLHALWPHVVA